MLCVRLASGRLAWAAVLMSALYLVLISASASAETSSMATLSREYKHVIHDNFDDGVLDSSLWSFIGGDPSIVVDERLGRLSLFGRTSDTGSQSGVDTAFTFPTAGGFEIVLQLTAAQDAGGGFAVEIHDRSVYYHATLMCSVGYFGLWYCYFGTETARGCHEASRSPLVLDPAGLGQPRSIRVRYDASRRQVVATVGGRLVGSLNLPLPLGDVVLRLFVQSPLATADLGEPVDYALGEIWLGWGSP